MLAHETKETDLITSLGEKLRRAKRLREIHRSRSIQRGIIVKGSPEAPGLIDKRERGITRETAVGKDERDDKQLF